ncbi:uncharacterized protein LOC100197450 isoform X1 [Hydra vulgaris]|uniref:uncharacterized protein LOC100197450 isoform X1 n=1 Tax=Hydra vulgaris TaxID=6087 RepID=UPI001F5F33C2|nr:uncharacterized protein LOC100197450 isoform X1 [Hydra vulgaris]
MLCYKICLTKYVFLLVLNIVQIKNEFITDSWDKGTVNFDFDEEANPEPHTLKSTVVKRTNEFVRYEKKPDKRHNFYDEVTTVANQDLAGAEGPANLVKKHYQKKLRLAKKNTFDNSDERYSASSLEHALPSYKKFTITSLGASKQVTDDGNQLKKDTIQPVVKPKKYKKKISKVVKKQTSPYTYQSPGYGGLLKTTTTTLAPKIAWVPS